MKLDDVVKRERPFAEWDLQGLQGAPALRFAQIPSTNRWVREHAEELEHGTVVIADQQDNGRGRFDRVWRSPAGKNLYFTLLLQPRDIPLQSWPQLTQVAALTLAKCCQNLGIEVHVKWPNDLLWNKHKLCGILSERTNHGGAPALALGIGININSDAEDFAGLDRLAASLSMILEYPLDREAFLRHYLQKLDEAFTSFAQTGIAPWLTEWRGMLNFVGSKARVVLVDKTVHGTVAGIKEDGSLLFLPEGASEAMVVYSGDLEV